MSKPRMPTAIRAKLAEAVERIATGPGYMEPFAGDHGTYEDGFNEATQRHAGWRHSWIEHELRQVLAWADGAYTAHEIETYSLGMEHPKGRDER